MVERVGCLHMRAICLTWRWRTLEIQQTHATADRTLGGYVCPPVLHRISPATIIRASSLALLLVHGRHAIDKARLLGKRNNLTFTTAQRLFVPGPGTRERKSGTMITRSGLLDQVPAQNDSFALSTLPPLPVDVVDCFNINTLRTS